MRVQTPKKAKRLKKTGNILKYPYGGFPNTAKE